MNTVKWKRPSGEPIETNDKPETIAYCESLGWAQVKKKTPKKEK